MQITQDTERRAVDVSVVIPVYNEEDNLPPLTDTLMSVLKNAAYTWEIVFVDDGSTDNSRAVLDEIRHAHNNIVLALHRANFGKSQALSTGFHIATGNILLTLDADLQDDPNEIPRLVAELESGTDLVIGWRTNRKDNDPITKTVPSAVANWMTRTITGVHLNDMNSGFKGFRREVVEQISLHSDLHRYIPVLAYAQGFTIKELPVQHYPRKHGRSKYGTERYIRSLFDLLTVLFLTRFRYRPLHFFGIIGLASGTLGVLISGYLTVLWFLGNRPIGDRPLLLLGVLLILVGIQFTLSGLVADLIVSIDNRAQNPLISVRTVEYSPQDMEPSNDTTHQ